MAKSFLNKNKFSEWYSNQISKAMSAGKKHLRYRDHKPKHHEAYSYEEWVIGLYDRLRNEAVESVIEPEDPYVDLD